MSTRDANVWKSASPRGHQCPPRASPLRRTVHTSRRVLPRSCLGGVELRVADLPPSPIICQKVDPTVLSFDNKSLLSRSYDKTTLTLEGSCRSARDCIVEKWFACVASVPLNVIQPNHMLRACTDVKLSDVTASRTARGAHPILE